MIKMYHIGIFLFLTGISSGSYSDWNSKWERLCPTLFPKEFTSYTPKGNLSAGTFFKRPLLTDMKQCVIACCEQSMCHVAMMYNMTCYHVQCNNSNLCMPNYRPDLVNVSPPSMVLVKPVEVDESWSDFFDADNESLKLLEKDEQKISFFRENRLGCSTSEDCGENEKCISSKNSVRRICECVGRYERNSEGICSSLEENGNLDMAAVPEINESIVEDSHSSAKPLVKKVFVKTVSKEVRLPENEVTLSAFTVPSELNGHYNYAWTLLSQPKDHTGIMTDQNQMTVKLSNLAEGLYKFKVTVSGLNSYGEAYANVTVLPPKRINQAPMALISPGSQIVKLPNTGAVLDGSTSTDDDKIISYHWELQQGPIGYQPNLVDTPTLQLDNLIAGNYTFKLTVEDSDNVKNFTTANITVLKITDYPPSANAGQDVIIYLPQNTLTLNGNLSTDDRGIASWEWTKSPSDENKAADMQNTRTPYLQLSNLEEGMYTFVLKVTDDSDQSSTSEVRVFVKPPTNKPPKADAGEDIIIALPNTEATLNGSKSKDDVKIVSYQWKQIKGPNNVTFTASNKSVTNITKLTKGDYQFNLTVIDDNGNKDSATVQIKVTQNENASPQANAGGDKTLIEPVNALILNGSQSSDDLRIKQWLWTRDSESLAIGNIVNGTDKSPILMVTDIVPGRYVFTLTVTDDQGLNSKDTASVIVKSDLQLFNLVKLTLGAHLLTESQKESLIFKLRMLLGEDTEIVVRSLKAEAHSGNVVLVFYVKKKDGKSMSGPEVVKRLKKNLRLDILQLTSDVYNKRTINVDTVICQNNCSGHGKCIEETRQCMCEAFWMQNLIQVYIRHGESNCEWSILYVIIALLSVVVCWIAFFWGMVCFCQRICYGKRRLLRPKKKPARYSLLQANPDDESTTFSAQKIVLSESDSDSDDVMFDKLKSKSNGCYSKNIKSRNGVKSNSRIKT